MRLITSAGLAFLLMLGIAASTHTQMEGSASETPGMSVSDANADLVGSGVGAEPEGSIDILSESDALLGAAMCVFGVLCGLTLMVFTRRLLNRGMFPERRDVVSRGPSMIRASAARPHRSVLSLTQLGLSRT